MSKDGKHKNKIDPRSPFASLKGLGEKLAVEHRVQAEKARAAKLEEEKRARSLREEEDLLSQAMAGVRPIGPTPVRPKKKPPEGPKVTHQSDDEEVVQELHDLVAGRAPLDFLDSDEYIEGRAADCSKLNLAKLRNGEFAVQSSLDLHGHNREEAKEAVNGFFRESMMKGYRCVLVVCGRGLHTPGGKPVLKELLVRWLGQGQLGSSVLAFSSAKRHDGGVGAIYILLRKDSSLTKKTHRVD